MKSPRHTRVFFSLFGCAAIVGGALLLKGTTPPPGWWQTKHVIKVDGLGTPVAANDYVAANQGQLKNMAIRAYEHLLENIPANMGGIGDLTAPNGTGYRLRTLISGWVVIDSTTGRIMREDLNASGAGLGTYSLTGAGSYQIPIGAAGHNDYRLINKGQLKAVALPFYDRLSEVYRQPNGTSFFSGGHYPKPWTDTTTADDADYAAANLGHLKNVFSFDLNRDSDTDGITDIQELVFNKNTPSTHVLNPFNDHSDGTHADATFFGVDTDGDGISDADEIALGMNPNVAAVADTSGAHVGLQVFTPLE